MQYTSDMPAQSNKTETVAVRSGSLFCIKGRKNFSFFKDLISFIDICLFFMPGNYLSCLISVQVSPENKFTAMAIAKDVANLIFTI